MTYHDTPESIPITPPLDAAFGFPAPDGVDLVPVFRADGTIRGVDYYLSGDKIEDIATVEKGLYDLTLRQYYHAWRRLARLAFLVCGPSTSQALEGVTAYDDHHFNRIHSWPASGEGTEIVITWETSGENPITQGLTYGVTVFDAWDLTKTDVNATANVAQIVGMVIGEGTATLTLTKPLSATREGLLYMSLESKPPDWPIIRLGLESGGPWRPVPAHLTRFFFGRGLYQIEGESADTYRIGRDDAESIGYMLGWPGTRWVNDGLTIYAGEPDALVVVNYPHKIYLGQGILKCKTDIVTHGIRTFENFETAQDRLGVAMIDNQGLLKSIVDGMVFTGRPAKKSPSGSGALSASSDPAKYAEIAYGMRRIGTQGVGETSAIAGVGEAATQRARVKTYLSRLINTDAAPFFDTSGETRIVGYSDFPVIPLAGTNGDNVEYEWHLAGYCDTLDAPRPKHAKGVSGKIAAISWTGNVAEIEFDLANVDYVYHDGVENSESTYKSGGNCVCPEQCNESVNPICGAAIGDRQAKITPGDVIRFGAGTGAAIVTAAEAFAGAEVAGASAPVVGAPGISDSLRAIHKKRDKITVQIVGPSGTGFVDEAIVGAAIKSVAHEAVSPISPAPVISSHQGGVWADMVYGDTVGYDPISGIVYVAPSVLMSNPSQMRAFGPFFDRRRTYPCEVANVLHGAINGACEGYASHAASSDSAHLGIRLNLPQGNEYGYHPVEWLAAAAEDHPSVNYPDESFADEIPLVFPYQALAPYARDDYEHKWVYDTAGDGVQGIVMVDTPRYMTAYGDIMGVRVPIPQRWNASEIDDAVCNIFIGDPLEQEQRIQSFGEGDSYFKNIENPMSRCKLAGYVVAYEWDEGMNANVVTSIRSAGLTLALGSLAEVDGGIQGTVNVTGIMQSLAAMTFTGGEIPFVGLIGPQAFAPLDNARDVLNSWICEYVFVPGDVPSIPDYWAATVGKISMSSLSLTNWRIKPKASAIVGPRYVETV